MKFWLMFAATVAFVLVIVLVVLALRRFGLDQNAMEEDR